MRFRKGQDFLNVVEMIVVLICLFLTFYFLSFSKLSAEDNAEAQLEEHQADFYNTQALRTFLQTPLEVTGERTTVSEAINSYYVLRWTLDQGEGLSFDERSALSRQAQAYRNELRVATETYLNPYVRTPDGWYTVILSYVEYDKVQEEIDLSRIYNSGSGLKVSRFLELKELTSFVQIPLYIPEKLSHPGSYYAVLSLGNFEYLEEVNS